MTSNIFTSINESWVIVITGPMFCGKTTEMLRIINRYSYAGVKAKIFNNKADTRNHDNYIQSRDGYKSSAIKVNDANEILKYVDEYDLQKEYKIIAIDETQFFDKNIVEVVKKLRDKKFIILCCGLDLDYKGNPFGSMPELLAIADDVIKLSAICTICGAPATKTFLINTNISPGISSKINEIIIGDAEKYEARCNKHFKYK